MGRFSQCGVKRDSLINLHFKKVQRNIYIALQRIILYVNRPTRIQKL